MEQNNQTPIPSFSQLDWDALVSLLAILGSIIFIIAMG